MANSAHLTRTGAPVSSSCRTLSIKRRGYSMSFSTRYSWAARTFAQSRTQGDPKGSLAARSTPALQRARPRVWQAGVRQSTASARGGCDRQGFKNHKLAQCKIYLNIINTYKFDSLNGLMPMPACGEDFRCGRVRGRQKNALEAAKTRSPEGHSADGKRAPDDRRRQVADAGRTGGGFAFSLPVAT
jgi:hypothetical protein